MWTTNFPARPATIISASYLLLVLACGCDPPAIQMTNDSVEIEFLPITESEVQPNMRPPDVDDIETWTAEIEADLTMLAARERLRQIDLILSELRRMELDRIENRDQCDPELQIIRRALCRWKSIRFTVVNVFNSNL